MTVYHKHFTLSSNLQVTFHDVTAHVTETVAESGVNSGVAIVYSQHTTCSIIVQEESHDTTYHGTKYILQDLVNVLERIIPKCQNEGQYLHPGPQHIAHATKNLGEEAAWSLNTDAHLRSCFMGRSESIPIIEGKLELGQFGQVYFVDFDLIRARERTLHVQIIGE